VWRKRKIVIVIRCKTTGKRCAWSFPSQHDPCFMKSEARKIKWKDSMMDNNIGSPSSSWQERVFGSWLVISVWMWDLFLFSSSCGSNMYIIVYLRGALELEIFFWKGETIPNLYIKVINTTFISLLQIQSESILITVHGSHKSCYINQPPKTWNQNTTTKSQHVSLWSSCKLHWQNKPWATISKRCHEIHVLALCLRWRHNHVRVQLVASGSNCKKEACFGF
jgi:hypothetical protein